MKLVDRMILEVLKAHSADGKTCSVSHWQIASAVGMSKRSVGDRIRHLCKTGELTSQQQGLNMPNLYTIQSGVANSGAGVANLADNRGGSFKYLLKYNSTIKGLLGDKILDNETPKPQSGMAEIQTGVANSVLPAQTGMAKPATPAQKALLVNELSIQNIARELKTTHEFVMGVKARIDGELFCGVLSFPPDLHKTPKSETSYHYKVLMNRTEKALLAKKNEPDPERELQIGDINPKTGKRVMPC